MTIQAECFKDSKYMYDYQAGPNIHMRKEERDQKNPITSISEFQIRKNSHVKFNNYVRAWLAQSEECVTLDLRVVSSSPVLGTEITQNF